MPDTILPDELIDRLGPFLTYPRIEGDKVKEEGGGTLLKYKLEYPDTVPYISHEYKIGDGRVGVYRQVLQKPELGVRHKMLVHTPLSIAGGKSESVTAELDNLTSSEAKRILRAFEDNPKLLQSLPGVPLVKYYKGRWGDFYQMAEDPTGNLENWLSELWDKQKNVPEDQIQFRLYPGLEDHHKKVKQELFDALNKRVHKSNALMTAGMGLAGALAGDEDSRIKTSILGALGAGLGTYGSAYASRLAPSDKLATKLYRTMVKRPGLRMGMGALGGLAGILAGKGTSGSDEGVLDELADKVEDLTGADVKGSDMLKYILLGGGGLAALGGLGYAATKKKKKKSKEKRDA